MALYKHSDLKKRNVFNSGVRELETPDNVTKKLWIPKFEFEYIRKHFGVKDRTPFKYSKFNFIPCFNQTLGDDGAGCPICKVVTDTWALWRAEKDKVKQKELTSIINQLKGEYYALNVIDIDDPDLKFQAISFTQPMFRELSQYEDSGKDISEVLWYFKKTKTKENTRYGLTAVDSATDVIKKLTTQLDDLMSRSYDDGGPIDLTKAFNRQYTMKEYMEILEPGENHGDERVNEDLSKESKLKDKPKDKLKETKKKDEPNVELAEEQISLDDLDSSGSTKEKTPDKEKIEEENLSLDDLSTESLDDLESLDSLEEVKLMTIDCKMVNERRNDKPFMDHLIKFFSKDLSLEGKPLKEMLMTIYGHVKKAGTLEVPEFK